MTNQNLSFKIMTQKGLILREMKNNPDQWFLVSHFCGKADHCFVGYKASTRIAELQKEGALISRWSDRTTALGTKLKEYKLAPDHSIITDLDLIRVVKGQPALFNNI